jgi:signal transduction histidine kinase
MVVNGDADLLRRVLENLVSNGIKHTPSGGRLRITVHRTSPSIRVAVQDEGPGVPAEARARIFERFGALAARKDQTYHSVGLGLAFCKLAVEAHGGSIGVDSAVPRGSVFWFELPG